MRPTAIDPQAEELDDFIRAYEAAWARGERVDLKAFLPEPGHPLYSKLLRELVRVDLEYGWDRGQPRSSFPKLFSDRESLQAITLEEYRLPHLAGGKATPAEYERRFGRALARYRLGDLPGAEADLTLLLNRPKPPLRAYFLRAHARTS